MAPPIHTSVSSLLFLDLTVDDLQNLEFGKAQGELSLLAIVCGPSEASTLLVGFACEHTPLQTHTPCEQGKVLASEASMALERQKWKPRARLVLVYLPTSLSKGCPWYLLSFALAQKRYQT